MRNTALVFRSLIAVLVSAGAAPPAIAQTLTTPRRAFVDAAFGPHWDDRSYNRDRTSGATLRSGFAIGFDFGKSGIEFDVGVPQWHVRNYPPERYQFAGQSHDWERQGHFYERLETVQRRSIDLTGLYRRNVIVNRQVTFTWLVGCGYVYRPEQYSRVTNELLAEGQRKEAEAIKRTTYRNYSMATAGLDAAFRIAPMISVVPRLRVTLYPSFFDDSGLAPKPLVARPELALRWRF